MKRKRFSVEQITGVLQQVEAGVPVGDVCRQVGVSEQTFYRWKKEYGGMLPSEAREMKQLRDENTKLKRLVADPLAMSSLTASISSTPVVASSPVASVSDDHTGVINPHMECLPPARATAADAAYDTVGFYDAAGARGATVVVPPTKTARVSRRRPRSRARDHTINTVKSIGRRRWKQTSRDHQHARVENAFFRYQSIIGDGLRARTPRGRTVEAQLACNMLNAMTDMGRPASYAVGR